MYKKRRDENCKIAKITRSLLHLIGPKNGISTDFRVNRINNSSISNMKKIL